MTRLTYYEREIIEHSLRVKKSIRAIARTLKRDHSVVGREIKNHSSPYLSYTAQSAQRITIRLQRQRTRKKLEKDIGLKEYVKERLRDDNSPEQIAGILKNHPPPGLSGQTLCHETIYQYIYTGAGRFENLYSHLRRKRHKRQKQRARKPRKTIILERISIHQRPEVVAQKGRYGDWESDSLLCRKNKQALSVQYERKSQLVRIHRVEDKSATETETALRQTIESLPQYLFQTITFDNGLEGAHHHIIRDEYGIQTFFCDAYASWQKGGVENINGLIRQYVPKNVKLSELTDQDVFTIQEKLNNRPRKNLNYQTPNQVIAQVGR